MRLKLKKDIEAPLRADIESKDKEIARVSERSSHYKREWELVRTELETIRLESQRELSMTKERLQAEISDLSAQVQTQQS